MLYLNTVTLRVEALVTACDKFVRPERIELTSLLRQPVDGSGFDVPLADETKFCRTFRACCTVCRRALPQRRVTPLLKIGTFSPDDHSQCFQPNAVFLGANCSSVFHEVAGDGGQHFACKWCDFLLFLPGEPACFHSVVDRVRMGVK